MKRFISYLYAVQNQQKTQNAGFARIEQRPGRNRIEIHLRDGSHAGKTGKVYLYKKKDGFLQGILLGDIDFQDHQADFAYLQPEENVPGMPYTIDQMDGILIQVEDKTAYLSQWNEETIDLQRFRTIERQETKQEQTQTISQPQSKENKKNQEQEYHKQKNQEQKTQEQENQKQKKQEQESRKQKKQEQENQKQKIQEQENQKQKIREQETQEQEPQEQKQSQEVPSSEAPSLTSTGLSAGLQLQKQESWEEKWRRMLRTYPVLNKFPDRKDVLCVKIELRDIRSLPQKYWGTMNNSFLLHGFFNYRYLIFGKIGQQWIIGIPGVFQNQEHVMASIFGFSDFLPQTLPADGTGTFGYWYRVLDMDQEVKEQ